MENRLLLNINLGSRRTGMTEDHNQETSLFLGSILDDNVFHEVMIARDKRDLVLSVDRVKIRPLHRGHALRAAWAGHLRELHRLHGEPLPQPLECVRGQRGPGRLGNSYETELYKYDPIGSLSSQCTRSQWDIPVTFRLQD